MDKTYDFIVNLHSRTGKAKEIWESLEEILTKDGVSYRIHITEYVGHATNIAEDLTADAAYHVSDAAYCSLLAVHPGQ